MLPTSTDPTRQVRMLLDDVALRITASGTRTERRALHAMADVSSSVAPGAATALVDWGGTEISRLRAFGVLHWLLVEELGIERNGRRDLQRPLAAVGKLGCRNLGKGGKPDRIEKLQRPIVETIENPLRAPEIE